MKKIIVTLTSWKGRINIVSQAIQSILNQDLKPNKIVLNLSHEEFPNKEKDLPDDIICLTNNELFEIFWIEENNKQFKKLKYTLERFPDDIVISVDDDFFYNKNFISTLYKDFIKNDCKYPITTWKNTKVTNDVYGTLFTHSGQGTITMSKFYGSYINILYDNLVEPNFKKGIKCFDDTIYTYAALLNNVKYKLCSVDFRKLILKEVKTNNGVSLNNLTRLIEWHGEIRDYIKNKYNKIFIKDVGLKELSLDNEITFIIPNRGGTVIDTVIKNFTFTFNKYFNKINFIVIEQCDEKPFVRGQLYNIAVKFCNTNFIALIDNDIYNLDSFDIIKKYYDFNGPYVAFDEITQIKINNTNYSIIKSEKRLQGFGAFSVMKKEDFIKANGFSNLCFGWGSEDNILNFRIKFKRFIHKLGHINHPRRVNLNVKSTEFNRLVLQKHVKNEINFKFDGYNQTTYELVYETCNDNILKIGVNNISVVNDYIYKNLYNKAVSLFDNLKSNYNPPLSEDKKKITNTNVQVLKHNKEIPKIIPNKSIQLKDNVNNKTITQEHNIVKETKIINNKKINFLGVEKAVSNIKKSDSNSFMTKNVNSIIKIKSKIINKQMKTSKNRVIKK